MAGCHRPLCLFFPRLAGTGLLRLICVLRTLDAILLARYVRSCGYKCKRLFLLGLRLLPRPADNYCAFAIPTLVWGVVGVRLVAPHPLTVIVPSLVLIITLIPIRQAENANLCACTQVFQLNPSPRKVFRRAHPILRLLLFLGVASLYRCLLPCPFYLMHIDPSL